MEVGLVIAMFVCNALALNFMVNGKHKLSGTFNIINLCLIVATAYQFELVDSIIMVLIIFAILIIIGLILNKKRKRESLQIKLLMRKLKKREEKINGNSKNCY